MESNERLNPLSASATPRDGEDTAAASASQGSPAPPPKSPSPPDGSARPRGRNSHPSFKAEDSPGEREVMSTPRAKRVSTPLPQPTHSALKKPSTPMPADSCGAGLATPRTKRAMFD